MAPLADVSPAAAAEDAELRFVAGLRLLLAATVLVVFSIDPTLPTHQAGTAFGLLIAYTVYSAGLYGSTLLGDRVPRRLHRWAPWGDVLWYAPLVALSGGPSSIFFSLFFFPILIAAFRSGFGAGMATTLVSAALFVGFGVAALRIDPTPELNRLLLRPFYLLAFGYVISRRGGFETLLQHRLGLLKEIGRLSNPRLGPDRTIAASLERLRSFYDADDCLLVGTDEQVRGAWLRRATRGDPERAAREDPLPIDLAERLLALPPEDAMQQSAGRWLLPTRVRQERAPGGPALAPNRSIADALADWLGQTTFVTVPVLAHGRARGRLYVAGPARRPHSDETEFLIQVVDHLLPLLESIRVIDRLATTAAGEERRKIGRDLHDGVLQTYLGIQLGLGALHRQLEGALATAQPGEAAGVLRPVAERIGRLSEASQTGIADLRRFVLRMDASDVERAGFLPILRGYTRQFAESTGIETTLEAAGAIQVNDRLAVEIFLMTAEALSNVRRHANAKHVRVRVEQSERTLELEVENDGPPGRSGASFTPRSITARAQALGGWAAAEPRPGGGARVHVTIPL